MKNDFPQNCASENIHTKIICLYNMIILGASAWCQFFSKKKTQKVLIYIVIQQS